MYYIVYTFSNMYCTYTYYCVQNKREYISDMLLTIFFFLVFRAVTGEAVCATGWSEYNGICYFFDLEFEFYSYQDCSNRCSGAVQGQYTTMVCIEDSGQNNFVAGLAVGSADYWIGYQYSASSGYYEWISGCSSTYENWNTGYPYNDYEALACVFASSTQKTWFNYECSLPIWCACQYTPGISVSPSTPPTVAPSVTPSVDPTESLSASPSTLPSCSPSQLPSETPSQPPSETPTAMPTLVPTLCPSIIPSYSSSQVPSVFPTPEIDPKSTDDDALSEIPFFSDSITSILILIAILLIVLLVIVYLLCCCCKKNKRDGDDISLLKTDRTKSFQNAI